jgi:hypothetical protein
MAEPDAPAMLPEHARNPFIAALGPIRDYWGDVDLFERNPDFSEAERRLPAHLRRYCMLRLLDLNVPLARQVELAERIGMVIRKSYEGRDPGKGLHHLAILDSVDRIENGDIGRVSARVVSTAMGFAVLGHPGMGKSRSVRIVLEALPKTLTPSTDSSLVQVPWVMIECQSLPTRKGLCIAILTELGRRVGMDYVKLLDAERKTADLLVLQVQNKLVVHAVGLLVIDEVQNLADSREGPTAVMNFLVMLVNTAGIPVMLVGTMTATAVIQRDFRGARRAAGLGTPFWERLRWGEEWDEFFSALMRYQWTRNPTPFSPEISNVFYDECQGILSVAVSLMVLVQARATRIGELHPQDPELITPELVRSVAAREFRIVKPMLAALRAGTAEALIPYRDLEHFSQHVNATVASAIGVRPEETRARPPPKSQQPPPPPPNDASALLRDALTKRGIGSDVIERIVAEARARTPSGDPLEMVEAVGAMLREERPATKRTRTRKPETRPVAVSDDPLDLRSITTAAKAKGETAHAALLRAGVVRPVAAIGVG